MENIWWKTRVTSTRMVERMKFLRAYWGRKPNGAPGREFPVSHVLLRAVELAFNEVQADLKAAQNGVIGPAEKNRAEWWLKMARDGRNGDPFPGVSYSAAEPVSDDPADPGTMSAIAAGRF